MEDMGVNGAFWAGRRVFVTGHTGFKGSWLVLWLESMGARVTGYALAAPSVPTMFADLNLTSGIESIVGDVRNLDEMFDAFSKAEPEIVFHLAAQSLVRPSYADPVATYATNVMGTVHLLESARRFGKGCAIVNVTSDKCYDNREWLWGYREVDRLGGHDPYSNSKGCAEMITDAYRRSFFQEPAVIAVATARAGNVIGGGDWSTDRLVPDVIRAFADGRTAHIRHPDALRPWQHVLEPLSGYLALAERLVEKPAEYEEAWNFGPAADDGHSVGEIVARMSALWGNGANWASDHGPSVHEARLLRLDSTKARTRLGWSPRWPVEIALAKTIEWYRAHAAGNDMRAFTLEQIAAYEEDRSE